MIDFVILIENTQRETDSDCLLAAMLRSRGYNCELLKYPFFDIFSLRRRYCKRVRVVIAQSMYRNGTIFHLVYKVFGKVDFIVSLHWEQIFTNRVFKDNLNFKYPQEAAIRTFHVCWGPALRDKLIEVGVQPSKILLTGPIHIDLTNDRFNQLYGSREDILRKFDISTTQKVLLFISSFAYTTLTEDQYKDLSTQLGEDTVSRFARLSIESKMNILKWLEAMMIYKPEMVVIYRPHPAEHSDKMLDELCAKYSNFRVISDGSIIPLIKASDYIYNWFSTSLIEVCACRKICGILRPIKIPYDDDVITLSGLPTIKTEEQFLFSLDNSNNYSSAATKELLANYYDISDHQLSSERLCDELIRIIENENSKFDWDRKLMRQMRSRFTKPYIKSMLYRVGIQVYRIFLRLRIKNAAMDQKLLTHDAVNAKYNQSSEIISERYRVISKYVE